MQKPLLFCLIVGGAINALSSLTIGLKPTTAIELFWIANDLFLLLGLIGVFLSLQSELHVLGNIALMVIIVSMAFIAGPSANIGDISAYSIGAPIIALGFVFFSTCLLKLPEVSRIISITLLATTSFNILFTILSINGLIFAATVLFSFSLIGLGVQLYRLPMREAIADYSIPNPIVA